ncbi:TlpA disulfide reductase family protein [uncultured Kordia sp.]|uniref:TlpA family protein disulfide reductase n=1 Tax=uncultured Kordia sp. TaxID=507699 RepID=UPI00261AE2DF|nr:TlpA disulfide reductase family protein [uncultured Kordia sp.]
MKFTLHLLSLLFINLVFSQEIDLKLSIKIESDEKIESVDFRNFRGSILHNFNKSTSLVFQNDLIEEYFFDIKTKDTLFRERVWLDRGNIDINISLKSKSLKIDVIGSEIFNKTVNYKTGYQNLTETNATDEEVTKFLFKELDKNIDNPFSYFIGLNILFKNQSKREVLSQLKDIINLQPESLKSHYTAGLLIKTLKSKLNSGNINLSNFTFFDLENKENRILIDNNEYLLLDFWHTACPPCLKDHIEIKSLITDFKNKKTKIVSLSSDQENRIETWKKYLKSKNLPWTNYIEKKTNSLTDNLEIRIFPTYILLDKNRDIVIYTNSLSEIKTKLEIK